MEGGVVGEVGRRTWIPPAPEPATSRNAMVIKERLIGDKYGLALDEAAGGDGLATVVERRKEAEKPT